jgi:hypothetical protein
VNLLHDPFRGVEAYGPDGKEARISFIEQALKRDPSREYRRQLVREFLDLTDPEPQREPDL